MLKKSLTYRQFGSSNRNTWHSSCALCKWGPWILFIWSEPLEVTECGLGGGRWWCRMTLV